ncbi:MAG: OmpW family outer membrane protein [Candidatus Aminicenantes bacterium]
MNKLARLFTVSVCLLILPVHSYSSGPGNTFFFGPTIYIPSENAIKTSYGSGLGTTLMITPNVVFSIEFKYGRFSVDAEEGKFVDGDLTLTPIIANIQYYFNPNTRLSPYVFGGVSFVFASFKADVRQADEDALITRQEPKNGIGFQGGLGASYNFSEQLAVYFEGYYLYRNTVVETSLFSGVTSQFDSNLSQLGVTIGIRYYY